MCLRANTANLKNTTVWFIYAFFFPQGVFIFFFHVIFNNEVRKNLKNVFTGKKSIPDEGSTTRASLLTVSQQEKSPYCGIYIWLNYIFDFYITGRSLVLYHSLHQSHLCHWWLFSVPASTFFHCSALWTVTTRTTKMALCIAQASASPWCLWTVRSGQPRAAAATWHTHSGTTRTLTAWPLLLLHCTMMFMHRTRLRLYTCCLLSFFLHELMYPLLTN